MIKILLLIYMSAVIGVMILSLGNDGGKNP